MERMIINIPQIIVLPDYLLDNISEREARRRATRLYCHIKEIPGLQAIIQGAMLLRRERRQQIEPTQMSW